MKDVIFKSRTHQRQLDFTRISNMSLKKKLPSIFSHFDHFWTKYKVGSSKFEMPWFLQMAMNQLNGLCRETSKWNYQPSYSTRKGNTRDQFQHILGRCLGDTKMWSNLQQRGLSHGADTYPLQVHSASQVLCPACSAPWEALRTVPVFNCCKKGHLAFALSGQWLRQPSKTCQRETR